MSINDFASLCFSIDFKWGQEIPFQRKTEGHKLNGFNIWELTAGNVTGRCNSGYNPAAELLGFDKKTVLGLSMPEAPGDWKDPGPARELFQVCCQGMDGLCTTFLPLGYRQYWLQLRWSCTIVMSNPLYCSELAQSTSAVSQHTGRRKGEIISAWEHTTSQWHDCEQNPRSTS